MADNNHGRSCQPTLIAGLGIGILTVNGAVALYRARGDVGSAFFVASSYLLLLLLFSCLRAYERARAHLGAEVGMEGPRRRIWCLCTLLTLAFAWKVASVVPRPLTVAVWAVAADAVVAGFFTFFLHRA